MVGGYPIPGLNGRVPPGSGLDGWGYPGYPLARSGQWEVTPPARSGWWGVPRVTPRPGLDGGGYPIPGLDGGIPPPRSGQGVLHPKSGWGILWGTPSQVWMVWVPRVTPRLGLDGGGYPIPGLDGGYPWARSEQLGVSRVPPGQVWMVQGTQGNPQARSGWCRVPHPRSGGGTPQVRS